jgi:glycosyltransferase involved in cell wall biosynthesis
MKWVALPFDLLLAIGWFLTALPGLFLARLRPSVERRAIFLAPGADIVSIQRKYGTLNVYLQDDPGYFDLVYRFNWGRINRRLPLRENFMVIERRVTWPLVLSGIASLFAYMAWVTWAKRMALIHARDPYFCGLLAWWVARLTGRLFCVSIHADYDHRYQLDGRRGAPTILGSRGLAKQLEILIFHKADLVMPIREHLARQAMADGVSPEKIRIIPHGIDPSPFLAPISCGDAKHVRKKLGLPDDKSLLSFVGRLSRENYVDDILLLTRFLANRRQDFVVVMAGDGKEAPRLRGAQEADSRLRNHLRMTGFLAHAEAIQLRKISMVNLCLMGGFSLIEACAAGRPVVAYDVEWHRELVKSGETGFLIPRGGMDNLMKAVEFLLDHPEEAQNMGEAARALALERHSGEHSATIKRTVYEELLRMAEKS